MSLRKEFVEYPFDLSAAVKRTEDKGNRIRQRIKSIRLGEYTDQFIRMRVIFPEGDERILRPGEVITVSEIRDFFTLEWVAQSGKTVLVEVSDEVVLQASPVPNTQTPQNVGSSFTEYCLDVTVTPTLLIPVNANRTELNGQHRGTVTWYCGSLATLNDALYQKKAPVILNPGDLISWNNISGLYFRTAGASDLASCVLLDEYK